MSSDYELLVQSGYSDTQINSMMIREHFISEILLCTTIVELRQDIARLLADEELWKLPLASNKVAELRDIISKGGSI